MFDRKTYSQKYYQEHKDEFIARKRVYAQDSRYKDHIKGYNLRYRQEHKLHLRQQKDLVRLEVLSHYSVEDYPVCANCSILDTEVLSIDHANNNGTQERKDMGWRGSGMYFYKYLKEKGYPEGYQILCHNCNWKKQLQFVRETVYHKDFE